MVLLANRENTKCVRYTLANAYRAFQKYFKPHVSTHTLLQIICRKAWSHEISLFIAHYSYLAPISLRKIEIKFCVNDYKQCPISNGNSFMTNSVVRRGGIQHIVIVFGLFKTTTNKQAPRKGNCLLHLVTHFIDCCQYTSITDYSIGCMGFSQRQHLLVAMESKTKIDQFYSCLSFQWINE